MGKVTNWVKEFAAWMEVRKICGTVEYRCKLCAERGTTLIWKDWRVCTGNTVRVAYSEPAYYEHLLIMNTTPGSRTSLH